MGTNNVYTRARSGQHGGGGGFISFVFFWEHPKFGARNRNSPVKFSVLGEISFWVYDKPRAFNNSPKGIDSAEKRVPTVRVVMEVVGLRVVAHQYLWGCLDLMTSSAAMI